MVKNLTGGKGSKSVARKSETVSSGRLRKSEDPDEIYAIVTKSLGNCMFYVNTIDGKEKLLLHLRGKFSGRNKRNNFISVGIFVLVGLRDYEKPNYKECDLLEIYSDQDVKRLITDPSISNSRFFTQSTETIASGHDKHTGKITDDDIIFSNVETIDNDLIIQKNKKSSLTESLENDIINFDEI